MGSIYQLLTLSALLFTGCPGPTSPDLPLYEEIYLRQKPKPQKQPENWSLDEILGDDLEEENSREALDIQEKRRMKDWRDFLSGSKSQSIGKAAKGKLVDGRILPVKGSGYLRKNDKAPYGTDETVAMILWACDKMTRLYPGTAPLVVGDLSARRGGRLKPHASHQAGRDVDLGYYFLDNKNIHGFKTATPDNLDAEKTWALISLLLATGQVKYLFIDKSLHRKLHDHALDMGWEAEELQTLFEAPVGKAKRSGVIRHVAGHKHHIHVRFRCDDGDPNCG